MMPRFAFLLLALGSTEEGLAGCGTGSRKASSESDQVTVVGKVTRIEDNVPADGGVTINIAEDNGGAEVLYFGSLFTVPRPSEERTQLYEKIRKVSTGDRVEAKGTRRPEGGIALEDITVLP